MNESTVAEKRTTSPPRGARAAQKRRRYTPAEKLQAVRLHLDEGFSLTLVGQELHIGKGSVALWVKAYRLAGEAGLAAALPAERRPKLPPAITDKILELKREHPTFGIKRISQLLRRWFFLPASPETVRQHLHAADLMPETTPPKKRNLTRPYSDN